MEVSLTGFPMVKLGNLNDTMKMVSPGLWMEDSWNVFEVLNSTASASSSRAILEFTGVPKVLDSAAKIACKE